VSTKLPVKVCYVMFCSVLVISCKFSQILLNYFKVVKLESLELINCLLIIDFNFIFCTLDFYILTGNDISPVVMWQHALSVQFKSTGCAHDLRLFMVLFTKFNMSSGSNTGRLSVQIQAMFTGD